MASGKTNINRIGNTNIPQVLAFDVEYLVIAGGGGGGASSNTTTVAGGGGGAGGYRSSVTGESSGGGASAENKIKIKKNDTLSLISS